MSDGKDHGLARQARLVAVVIAAAMVIWMGGQWIGGKMGWDPSYAILLDLFAAAAMVWSLIVTWRIWRHKSDGPKGR